MDQTSWNIFQGLNLLKYFGFGSVYEKKGRKDFLVQGKILPKQGEIIEGVPENVKLRIIYKQKENRIHLKLL